MSKKHDFGGMTIDASEPIRISWGGPAFPSHGSMGEVVQEGMTLRDYFAAKAVQAIMSDDRYRGVVGVNNYELHAASDAYKMADAMLKARAA